MKTITTILMSIILLTSACSAEKKAAKKEAARLAETNVNYPLVVEFISIGAGIDNKALETLKTMSNSPKKLKYVNHTFGREGEIDFCYLLKELNDKEKAKFITDVKEAFKGNNLVILHENSKPVNKK